MITRSSVLTLIIGVVIGAAIGAMATALLLKPNFPSQWFPLAPEQSDSSVPKGNSVDVEGALPISYSGAVIIDSDIVTPKITYLSGRAKFLPRTAAQDDHSAIGYILSVSMDPLERSKLPDKYKKKRIINTRGGPLTVLPLSEATYEVYFRFRLIDRDGFKLKVVDSPKHSIRSGQTSQIKAQTQAVVSRNLASLTDHITLHMVVNKCLSATSD